MSEADRAISRVLFLNDRARCAAYLKKDAAHIAPDILLVLHPAKLLLIQAGDVGKTPDRQIRIVVLTECTYGKILYQLESFSQAKKTET
jgi:hypothetical protein